MHEHSPSHVRVCAHCGSPAVSRPSLLWRLAIVPAWITVALMVLGAGMVGPLVMFVIPPLLVGGASLLSVVHARASAPAECEACGKIATASCPGARVTNVPWVPTTEGSRLPAARAA